jgi:hypothetical protein
MSLDEDYAVGMSRADESLAESRIALAQHQAALDLEQKLVHKFFEDLVTQLPMAEIEKHDIYRDGIHWTQLMFVHHGPPGKSEVKELAAPKLKEIAERASKLPTLTSIASIKFETSQQQFIYADFMSNFERRLPLPPNHNSFPVIAKYLGQSVRWWAMSEDDRRIQREVDKGLRETLGSLSSFTEPD